MRFKSSRETRSPSANRNLPAIPHISVHTPLGVSSNRHAMSRDPTVQRNLTCVGCSLSNFPKTRLDSAMPSMLLFVKPLHREEKMVHLLVVLIFLLLVTAPVQSANLPALPSLPELPRAYVDTAMPATQAT